MILIRRECSISKLKYDLVIAEVNHNLRDEQIIMFRHYYKNNTAYFSIYQKHIKKLDYAIETINKEIK